MLSPRPVTSVSSRQVVDSPSKPPRTKPAACAVLDLTKPGERRVEALLRWAAIGEKPLWLPLAIRRHDDKLLVAVEWGRRSCKARVFGSAGCAGAEESDPAGRSESAWVEWV